MTSLKLGLGRLKHGEPYGEVGPTLHAEVCHLDALFDNLSVMLGRNVLPVRSNQTMVNLVELCLRVQMRFELLASDRRLALELGVDQEAVMAFVDEIPMEQAIGNVVHNAIGYATKHVAIVVTQDAEHSIIRVDDDGPGIDLADPDVLTQRWTRWIDERASSPRLWSGALDCQDGCRGAWRAHHLIKPRGWWYPSRASITPVRAHFHGWFDRFRAEQRMGECVRA